MDDLLQQGIIAHKAGKRDEARKCFIAAIKQNRDNERAWQFMYNVANDDKERLSCLQQVLHINPQNEKANILLNQLINIEPHMQVPIKNIQPQTSSLKKCPNCAEMIQETAKVCRFCGRDLPLHVQKSPPKEISWIAIGIIGFIAIILGAISLQSYKINEANIAQKAEEARIIEEAKRTPGSLEGVVTWVTQGMGNVFVVGVSVNVWANGHETQRTVTDSEGKYQIKDLLPGTYTVWVYEPASTYGDQIAEKCWVFKNIKIQPKQITTLYMDFNNTLNYIDPLCTQNTAPPSGSSE